MKDALTPEQVVVRHASATSGDPTFALCGSRTGRSTRPKEFVNCPDCRVILNHTREQYPLHADYQDWRLTQEQERESVQAMYRDLVLGEIDDD